MLKCLRCQLDNSSLDKPLKGHIMSDFILEEPDSF